MKPTVIISVQDNEYYIKFIRPDGSIKMEWSYYTLINACSDIEAWLAEDDRTVTDGWPMIVN